jgi:thiamine kinase-like enzyme
MNRLYQNSTNNGRTGYALTSAAPNGSLRTVYNVTKGRKSIRPGMARVAAGQQGVIFLASTDPNGKKKIIIKVSPKDKAFSAANQPAQVEYTIQKALYKVSPRHIPKPINFFTQDLFIPVSDFSERRPSIFDYKKQSIMTTEYAHGGTLKTWMRKMGSRITDKVMSDLIRQVISTLKRIHDKYPEFRHNDLHLGNILVDDTKKKPRLMITDFGLSRLTTRGSNPVINAGSYKNSGISNITPVKYDIHYFLNALDSEISGGLPETRAFLARMLPGNYRGANTNVVKAFRLKNGASNTGLPSFTDVLRDPYISGKGPRAPRAAAASLSPTLGAIFRSATPNAADIATRALANVPGVSISRPSAANFMRMSPRSRAAFFTRTRDRNASRSIVVRNVTRTRGANVVRETVRRAPTRNVSYLRVPTTAGPARVSTSTTSSFLLNALRAPRRVSPTAPTSARRTSPGSTARPSSVRRTRIPMPNVTHRERTALNRTLRAARRNAAILTRARAGSRLTPKQILNRYTNEMNNLRTLTRRMLKTKLTQNGYSANNANRHARNWESNWIGTRSNANRATRNLKKGKNLVKRAYAEHVIPVAHRRVTENLSKSGNGRVRKGKTLLASKKKANLVAMARRHGITGANAMTKNMIISALYG